MSNLQTHYRFKLDFQKVDQHRGGKWLIHGTKRRKDQSIAKPATSPVEYPSKECKHAIKESKENMFEWIFKDNVKGQKHPRSCAFAEPEILIYRKPKRVVQNEKNGPQEKNGSQVFQSMGILLAIALSIIDQVELYLLWKVLWQIKRNVYLHDKNYTRKRYPAWIYSW